MTRALGWYVHHHGDGHRQRAMRVAALAPDRFTLLGTGLNGRTGGLACVDLADDRIAGETGFHGRDGTRGRPTCLHYAPLDHEGVRRRTATIADWIVRTRPGLVVVDVSVEVALLVRLASTPVVYVRLAGSRIDPPHLAAFESAEALLAPFHPDLDDPGLPAWVRDRTRYAPGLCGAVPARDVEPGTVLAVFGRGGAPGDGQALARAARSTPDVRWTVVGPVDPIPAPLPNLICLGWVDDVEARIARAEIVVGAAGTGVLEAVLAAGRPYVCLPQTRPFDEQVLSAARLAALGAAVVVPDWPDGKSVDWPAVLGAALRQAPEARLRLSDPEGLQRTADYLLDLAERGPVP